ncbi:MAG: DEAD/DEAH box helicase [Chloroflexi bacterium]|nr:DEAD/DEAH box helicase [Chloroflexota bacterium]
MPLSALLRAWRTDPSFRSSVAAWRTFPAIPPQFAPFPDDLHPALAAALRSSGIKALYTHQATAWRRVHTGQNLVVVTSTASGKTLCYNLPVLDSLLRNPQTRALYLFPTKALAQDQHDGLQKIRGADPKLPVRVATYDGDTPPAARPAIRKTAQLVISNPDMLHSGLLPHHTLWAGFFQNLRFVIIDEMHSYRGVFGSHVANVLRRLKRVARFYGAAPQFILTSATIANPVELGQRLIEEDVTLVDDDGSARGERHFFVYNPPIVNRELGIRRSTLLESVRITEDLLRHDVQTILFARARRTVELILGTLRRRSVATHQAVRGYRGGYLPRERREIERGLREGSVRAVVATNALELGVDIGGMGAAVLAGYPGTIAGTWQQAGRAGRKQGEAMAILITSASPLDQFLARHPEYLLGRAPEQALINPNNLLILLGHLRCAAFELPFREGEGFGSVEGPDVAEILEFLVEAGVVHRSGDKFFWMADHYPAQDVSLRSASPEAVLLQTQNENEWITIGQVDQTSAHWMVHAGAVYLHDGQTYLVERLDLAQRIAQMRPADLDYYTEPRTETTVRLLDKADERPAQGAIKAHGEVAVTTEVVGFRKIKWFTHELLGEGEVSLPPTELVTTGYWVALDADIVEGLRQQALWSNDPNQYGPDWPAQRERARARDRYRCQACGAEEGGRAHHVHHKTPFRTFAGRREANVLSNLVTLCPRCHRRAELAVRIRSGLAGVAFVLGHLAPLFLMCDTRDLGVHFDPQSALAEGRPTVVLYDQVPGGIGFSERLFALHDNLLADARDVVLACECATGCPSCTGPGGEDGFGGKEETIALLKALTQK